MRVDWRVPVLAATLLVAGCGGGGGGGGGDAGPVTAPPASEPPPAAPPPPPASPFTVSNPFAVSNATSVQDIRVDDLRVFGDSYSVRSYEGTRSWSTVLRENGTASSVDTYAISGARAAAGTSTGFDQQLDSWQANGSAIGNRDLTVAYFGYNDLSRDLAAARSGYRAGVDRLVAAGAASNGRKLFVTQLHDWSKNPSVANVSTQNVRDWNSFVADVANGNSGIVAVDLFTVFERIFADPAAYGFSNVTSVDRANSDSTAMFFDGYHFGDRGQEIIARVYRHYLTRGWDWANNIAAGSNAAARLNQDLTNGRLVLDLAGDDRPLGLVAIPIGTTGDRPADSAAPAGRDPARTSFSEHRHGSAAAGGIALDYRLDQTTSLGLAMGRYDAGQAVEGSGLSREQSSDALALYWQQAAAGFTFASTFSYLEHSFADSIADPILGQAGVSRHDGRSWRLDQRVARPSRAADATLVPWASLSFEQHELEPYTAAGLYTSELRYGGDSVADVLAGAGLDIRHDPIAVGSGRWLWLSGGVAMTASLHRDDAELSVSEAAQPGVVQRESVEREPVRRLDLTLDAVLGLSEAFNLRAGYAFVAEATEPEQSVRFSLDYRF